jgi:hypothetical protein
MKNRETLIIILSLVTINGVLGHFFPPLGIDLTPLVIITSALLILLRFTANVYIKSLVLFGAVVLNDVLIKLYSGGNNDQVGLLWIHLFMLIGLIIGYPILIAAIIRDKEASKQNKMLAALAFLIALCIYYNIFYDLGLGRSY